MKKCLFCYKPLNENEIDFHSLCSKKMFGTATLPILNFDQAEIEKLAKKIIVKSIAITGVQSKLSLQLEKNIKETPRLTIVGLYGDFILKPQSDQYTELPQNEDLTMHLAELIKIKTAKHTLIRLKTGELAYITGRFDRQNGQKIAVEDLCQLSENLTEHKYRSSIEKVGKIVHQFTENKGFEIQRLFELVLFCYFTGNADMHLKNFSLIENTSGEYQLSPAYDLLNTKLIIKEDSEESALTINGRKNKLKKSDFDTLAENFRIGEKALQSIYKRFQNIQPQWIECVQNSFLSAETKQQYCVFIQEKMKSFFE